MLGVASALEMKDMRAGKDAGGTSPSQVQKKRLRYLDFS